jgi:hypothetical protein
MFHYKTTGRVTTSGSGSTIGGQMQLLVGGNVIDSVPLVLNSGQDATNGGTSQVVVSANTPVQLRFVASPGAENITYTTVANGTNTELTIIKTA